METYCVRCKENPVNENPSERTTRESRLILVPSFAVCGKKKLKFIKKQ